MSEIVQPRRFCGVCTFHDLHVPIPIQLPQRNMYAQLTRCFSAVAELLVIIAAANYVFFLNYVAITMIQLDTRTE